MKQNKTPESAPRRLITPVERFLFLIALAILAFFVLKSLGVPVLSRTDETEILEHPHR